MTPFRPGRLRFAVALVLVTACVDSSTAPPSNPPPPPPSSPPGIFYGTVVDSNAANTISARAIVTATGYDSVYLRFWRDGDTAMRSPAFPFGADSDSTVVVPVLGLDTVTTYSIETDLVHGDTAYAVDTATFRTGSLPAWIPRATGVGTGTPGYVVLSYPDGPVVVDNSGKVVWYLYRPDAILTSVTPQADGHYTWGGAAESSRAFAVLDDVGDSVGSLGCVGHPTRFHDVLVHASGDAWLLCDDTVTTDLTAYGGPSNALVAWTVVQHLDSTGTELFSWDAADHFALTDLPAKSLTSTSINATHGNGIVLDTDGNILISSRELSEITKIDAKTGDIIWRFGGSQNQFTILNDPKGSFQRQHGLEVVGPDEIQLLDDGDSAPSRLVRYRMDPAARTATLVWSFVDAPTTFTPVGGNSQVLANGHALVSFGKAGRVDEVDANGNRVWQLTGIDGEYVFRAERITSLYGRHFGDPVGAP
ncbi:MAG TPA: arylsulfotransferase family protein [Gemmatimonadales bacterium]|nr:arylsulfotransferase family protein [Gemmatimonadales bacterium]